MERYIKDLKITKVRHRIISGCIRHRQRKGLGDFIEMKQNTVESHLKYIFAKLQIHTFSELIMLALLSGYTLKGTWNPKNY
jgi:hypothetical protein